MIRKASPGRGRKAIIDLADHDRAMLDEISDLEFRLARCRDVVVAEAHARSQPPRNTPVRAFMR
jgi:hypothetical protein